jgi:hypothetical protein
MNYPSLRIEGAILSPDLLDRLDDLPGQKPQDFGLDSTAKVKDEIARAWADAQDYWRIFQRKLETLKPDSPATTETRQQWVGPLLGLLGYQLEYQSRGTELNGKLYSISHRATNRANAPVQIVGYREPAGLDRKPERANVRMSAHAVVQEFINLNEQLYGVVTNGRVLRLLRDSSRLIRLSYVEFDLDRIFGDGLFADFAVMYRLLHATRLPLSNEAAAESWIERYHQDSLDSGARIREGLSRAVEQAIRNFGNGFLAHPENEALRTAVASGGLTPVFYYQHLLRLIYRLLFLMVIEERDLVFPLDVPVRKREIYRSYYSLQRLRLLSERRYLADHRRHDLWLGVLSTFRLFEADGPGEKLGLAPLAGDLFGSDAIGPLATCSLGNDVLLGCLRSLSLYTHPENGQLIRVNYGALNVEEFGSVYEGLLEYEAIFAGDRTHPEFGFKIGDERSRTGSHYTPDDLVQPLIKHSLDYLIAERLKAPDPTAALLDLRVADISCGSGHILLAAARRIATELAIVRTGEEQPSPSAYRSALRDVIRHCIYGVDLNPLAVELCKVALWLEAHNPGQPLNFLDHHIKCGNSIMGFARREEVDFGVPDEAFAALPGDEKGTAAVFRKKNKDERAARKQVSMQLGPAVREQLDSLRMRWHDLADLPERTPADIETKKQVYAALIEGPAAGRLKQIADIPISQFFVPKASANREFIVTQAEFDSYWSGQAIPSGPGAAEATRQSRERRFFHWFIEFPEVMSGGGFDCILGNPPYKGGVQLSGSFGHTFCAYVKWRYAPTGLSDLVVFFVRRIFSLLKPGGFGAFLTTNSIKDGDIRKDGLEVVLADGGVINFAVRGIKWPGRANLVVSELSIHRGEWRTAKWLDGAVVDNINGFLDDSPNSNEPSGLAENSGRLFAGYDILGDGFVLKPGEAPRVIADEPRNAEVILPVLNGQELNNNPSQVATRSVICFWEMQMEVAATYSVPFSIVRERVKPFRDKQKRDANREYWWQYNETRVGLRRSLLGKKRCFGAAATTKHLNFSELPTNYVATHAIKILATDRWDIYCIVQSSLHELWARKYSGALKQDLRYSPSDCFETYAFPVGLWDVASARLAAIGERYHAHRKSVMASRWLGLTDIYNLFHSRDLSPEQVAKVSKKSLGVSEQGYQGILELRRLHRELDLAVRDAYGWQDLDLGHDFHDVETLPENDRVRYTISPAARKEVLKRLLAVNHERAAEEKATAAATGAGKKGKAKKKGDEGSGELFG